MGEPALEFPYRSAGHRLIADVGADAVDPALMPILARDIGAALGAVHLIPEEVVRSAGVHEQDPTEAGRAEWLELEFETAFTLRGRDPVLDDALRWLARVTLPIHGFDGRFHLIHQDLGPEHLIVTPACGHLAGILDWTDATLGDTARDFVFLKTWRGWRFAHEVLRNYPLSLDDGFAERLRFLSRLLSIMWLATASRESADLSQQLARVRNAFAA